METPGTSEKVEKALVVLIDDDESLLAAVSRTLRREPSFDVRKTTSPHEVLDWVRNEDVAVLLADYEMPEMNGAQLAGMVRVLRPETVRILLTGNRRLETAIDGINQGEIFRFLTKPYDDVLLRRSVHEAIARNTELKALTGDRERKDRRDRIRQALEADYPGIATAAPDRTVTVTEDPWLALDALGLHDLRTALEQR